MERTEDLAKKEKAIQEIKEISRRLQDLTNFIFNCDKENPEAQQKQLAEAANDMIRLINKFADRNYLNSVCLKVFVGAVQFALKSFYDTLKSPSIVRPEDLH